MNVYRAAWLLPIADAPIRDGWVAVDEGRIASTGSGPREDAIDLGRVAVLPALVNAHTHLELSYLHGRIPSGGAFTDWIRAVMAARREMPDPADPRILDAARAAIARARDAGTGLLGDISNTLVTVPLLREAGMAARVFYELLGLNESDPEGRVRSARTALEAVGADSGGVRASLAPHAPYSVSPGLFEAIRADLDERSHGVSSVHLGESADEVELMRQGTGAMRSLLEGAGVWPANWRAPGTTPVEYLSELGFLDSRVLAVHGVQFSGDDLGRLRSLGATIVTCPRSNRYVGAGDPPIEAFYALGVRVAFGTDSLASVADLNVFAELAAARRLAPRVRARDLLESATLCGARALGFERDFGSIEPGKQAALIAVRLPEDVGSVSPKAAGEAEPVEEYLVSGVEPDAVTWLDAITSNSQDPTPKER